MCCFSRFPNRFYGAAAFTIAAGLARIAAVGRLRLRFAPDLRGSLLWGGCIPVLALPSLFLCVWNLNTALPYVPRRHQGTSQADVSSMANVLKFHAGCFSGHYRFVWIWGCQYLDSGHLVHRYGMPPALWSVCAFRYLLLCVRYFNSRDHSWHDNFVKSMR